MLKPVYTPPTDLTGDIILTLTATGNDTSEVLSDSVTLNVIENNVLVDAGSDEETYVGEYINFANFSTPPSASNYSSVIWDDGGTGGVFTNKKTLQPIYTPASGYWRQPTFPWDAVPIRLLKSLVRLGSTEGNSPRS